MATHARNKDGNTRKLSDRIELDDGSMSPVLHSRLLKAHRVHGLSSLSYGALVELNRALSEVRNAGVQSAGGAYGQHEHHKYLYVLAKHVKPRIYEDMLPWLRVNCKETSHYSSFARALEYSIFLNIADHTLTADELRELTGTQSVFITMSQMKRAELIGTSGKANGVVTFALTEKGKMLVRLACDSMERQENTLRSILFKQNP